MKLLRQTPPDPSQLALDLFPAESALQPVSEPASSTPSATSTKPGAQNSPGKRRIQLQEHLLEYRLLRSKRRTIGFLIDDEGLRMTAPRWVTIADIENAIREKQRWIFAKLHERRERSARRLEPQMQWVDGATLPYLGVDIRLRILHGQAAGVAYNDATRELSVSLPSDAMEQQLKDRVQAWLQAEAKRIFSERLPLYAQKLGVQYRSFALSSATTQWGSCTSEGKIRLNWRLIHFALPMIDYVVAHELSHLREMNHSPRFWATVQSIFPDFESARRVLRASGPETLPAF